MVKYALMTPARNEEEYIEKTIKAVISQTLLPEKWIIVSDGSTDRTEEIVSKYIPQYGFIELLTTSGSVDRNFGSKARALEECYKRLKNVEFDYVGNLDADVSFERDYFDKVIDKFKKNDKLGVAGGIRFDWYKGKFNRVKCAKNSVGGPFQLFRRECYEAIGGYMPLEYGGIDAVAEIMARWHGWEVESFPEIKVYHYRRTGTASGKLLFSIFRSGIRDYLIGYHPLYQVIKAMKKITYNPILIGGFMSIYGYFYAAILKYERQVPADFVKYLRSENKHKLKSILSRKLN